MTRVSVVQRNWLKDLPPLLYGDTWLALHGAPIDPTFFNAYVYEMTYHSNLDVLQRKRIPLCFHGHTHQPGLYARKRNIMDGYYSGDDIALDQFTHALICPGSIGQPRNGQKGAQFAIYDQEEHKIHYQVLPYDVEIVTRKMEAEGFPQTLIHILRG